MAGLHAIWYDRLLTKFRPVSKEVCHMAFASLSYGKRQERCCFWRNRYHWDLWIQASLTMLYNPTISSQNWSISCGIHVISKCSLVKRKKGRQGFLAITSIPARQSIYSSERCTEYPSTQLFCSTPNQEVLLSSPPWQSMFNLLSSTVLDQGIPQTRAHEHTQEKMGR